MKMTVHEFAKREVIPSMCATHVVQFLCRKGLIHKTDEVRKNEGARGRPSIIYDFPENLTLRFEKSNGQ